MISSNKEQFNSTIGEGSSFEGSFYVAGSLKIEGRFDGELKTEEVLDVKESGKVQTNTPIKTKKFVLSGNMRGDVEATESSIIKETGRFMGDIAAPILNLAKGAVIKGFIMITGGHKKDIENIIKESFEKDKK